ncbi:MAG: SOS response-associated peptidase [Methanomicrobiales archaeon]|nr:SOS response-associated peptidase [Methanomicrobiales archaeon]
MCGRFTIIPTIDFHERFGLADLVELAPRYNVSPGQPVPVILREERNRVVPMIWGLIPSWAKDGAAGRGLINARAESLGEKPAFRGPLQKGRCLVPASGFYEWRKEGRRRIPWYIRVRDAPLISFAGLYDRWRNPAGTVVMTFTIVTTEPNRIIAPLHDRMPAILPREKEEAWLGAGALGPGDLNAILAPYNAGEMEAFPVSREVNDPESDGPGLIRPLTGLTGPGASPFRPGT